MSGTYPTQSPPLQPPPPLRQMTASPALGGASGVGSTSLDGINAGSPPLDASLGGNTAWLQGSGGNSRSATGIGMPATPSTLHGDINQRHPGFNSGVSLGGTSMGNVPSVGVATFPRSWGDTAFKQQ